MPSRNVRLIALLLALLTAVLPAAARAPSSREAMVYIGTQGDVMLSARLDLTTGSLGPATAAAQIARPTWIALAPARPPARTLLFSVSELGNGGDQHGQIHSLVADPETGALTPLSHADSGGGGPTHLSYDRRAASVFVAHFGGAQVAALPVTPDGHLLPPASVQVQTGSGPHPKQRSAHAHAAVLDPGGHFLLAPDMGADRIFVYQFDPASRRLTPASVPSFFTGPGTGPRHMSFSADGRFVYLITEHAADIRVLRWLPRSGTLAQVQTVPLDPPAFTAHSAAEIAVSPDGRFIYASNRARNRIHVFAINRSSGQLAPVQDVDSGGQRPRSFGIAPGGRWMLVGDQDSQTIAIFAIDPVNGRLSQHGTAQAVSEKPVAFAFLPLTPPPAAK